MARRREYISFFSDARGRRHDLPGFRRRTRFSSFLFPALALCVLAVSVWWWAVRDTGTAFGEVITLQDTDVARVLLPTEVADEDESTAQEWQCIEPVTNWATFQGDPARTGCIAAPTITTPRILWEANPGVQGWLNSPIIANDMVYVGSAGNFQGQRDHRDGVYAYDLASGEQVWFFGAELDVNGIGFADGVVVATGDEGRVWGLDAENGTPVWTDDLEFPTFGNPLTVGGTVVIGDQRGRVTAYEIRTGARRWQQEVSGPVRGGAASNGQVIVITGEHREVLAVDLEGREQWRVQVRSGGPGGDEARLWNAPTIVGDLVILGLLHDDTYIEPRMIALDVSNGQVVWEATDSAGIKTEWGSIRSSPAAVGDLLVYGEGYGNWLVAVDTATGQTRWSVPTGAFCYPHWPSPAIVGDQVILPRHDGGLYAVSLSNRELVWSVFLGDSEVVGFPESYPEGFCEWRPEEAFPIQASPAVSAEGVIVIGTLEGRLVAIANRD